MRNIFSVICIITAVAIVACENRPRETVETKRAEAVGKGDSVHINVDASASVDDLPLIDSALIVADTTTGLVWMKNDFSFIEGRFLKKWDEIFEWREKINKQKYAGFEDWRVPTIKEYRTINKLSEDRREYAMKFNEMDSTSAWGDGAYAFWSATTPNKYTASYMSFIDGFATSGHREKQMGYGRLKGELGMSVRLVRGSSDD